MNNQVAYIEVTNDRCLRENTEKLKAQEAEREKAKVQWEEITRAAAAKGITVNA